MLKAYFKSLADVAARGDAREESFYSTLERLLHDFAAANRHLKAHVTTLPKNTEAGNPDFRVWDGQHRIIGYIEAKRPTEEHLDAVEESEQLRRYLSTFPNVILTNFFEFRLYRNGERIAHVLAARPYVLNKLGQVPPVEKGKELLELLEQFFSFSLPQVYTAESLATELAKRTRFLRDVVTYELQEETERKPAALLGFYDAFQQYLIAQLSLGDFADLYAQTVTYGLFAARTRAGDDFGRKTAFQHIPRTIGILRDVFQFISLGDLPEQLEWIVDDIAEVLAVADAGGILDHFYREGKGADPIVHFYETFLAVYDPAERERRGVYYTPEPVVSYIVRSLHGLLKTDFAKPDGLASDGVTLLDPAAGTMTFVARAAQEAVREFEQKYGAGGRDQFIRDHILKSFYAFELMMAPYAVGHLKMAFYLEELGHRLADDERFRLYLTNALEMEELEQTNLPGMRSLAHESHAAAHIKKQVPILVILGNPPYSGHSANRGKWIREMISDYQQIDGHALGEVQQKWLHDDYVKFLRFAQWKIDQAGRGVIGMITNHSYLDNPTFRGMRQSLMRSFDEIRVLNLHGNSLKRERAPGNGPDENVFDIRQGVAIAFFIKRGREGEIKVHHAEQWGTRESKYTWLAANEIDTTVWREINPKSPFYLFVPRDEAALDLYSRFPPVPEIFPEHSVGIVTARDRLTIRWTPQDIWVTVSQFARLGTEEARLAYELGADARDWKVQRAQEDIRQSGPDRDLIQPIVYRPFDVRYTYYTGRSRGFIGQPQQRIMTQLMHPENLALSTTRNVETERFTHAFVADRLTTHHTVSVKEVNYCFPLYLYPDAKHDLFNHMAPGGERQANLNPQVVAALTEAHGREPTPENVFHYVYAVLYAPSYREMYIEFLKTDFPRIPFTPNRDLFQTLAELGRQLVELHLLRAAELDSPAARFHGTGDNRVAKSAREGLRHESETERVWINKSQYFAPVPVELWQYTIGGYQVLQKWLKDRRGRQLSLDEIRTYCRIVTALRRTVEIQEEIDALYAGVEEQAVEVVGRR